MAGPVSLETLTAPYDFFERTVVITGGTGVLGAEMARALSACNATVCLIARDIDKAEKVAATFTQPERGGHLILRADVLDLPSLEAAAKQVVDRCGRIDMLVNGAGGNDPKATTSPDNRFFALPAEALQKVLNLNLLGTVLPTQAFGKWMAARKEGGVILNVSSVNAAKPLTRIAGYSAAKAAVTNFTQWLAVHLAQEYSPLLRVNALMPGFFLTEQNRFLLTDKETGELTARGKKILEHTPMARFGAPDDLIGAMLWLLSPASKFVTGAVIPVDGGFTAFSGV